VHKYSLSRKIRLFASNFVFRTRCKIGNLQACFGRDVSGGDSLRTAASMRPILLEDEQSLVPTASPADNQQLTDSAAENVKLQDRLRASADVERLEQESAAHRAEIARLQSSNQNAHDEMEQLRRTLQDLGRAHQHLESLMRLPKGSV
jgi:hypothetical protein